MDDRRNLWFLCATVGAQFITITLVQPLIPLYAAALGASPGGVGLIIGLYSLLPLFCAVPAGMAVDAFGARGLLAAGAIGLSLTSLVIGLWPGLIVLTLAQTLRGLAQLMFVVAAQAYTASIAGRREANFGWFSTFASAGQLAGPLVGGALVDARGFPLAFLAAGALSLLPLLFIAGLGKKRPAATAPPAVRARGAQIRRLFRNDAMKAAIAASFAVRFAMGARQAFFPRYLQGLGFSVTAIGTLLSLR
ncbi:MAG TPA: MFS transporter, partial [Limnochordia bacterium]